MDLIGVHEFRVPRTRQDALLAPGERALGGGTWLFSERQEDVATLVDLTALDWTPIETTDEGLTIGATCTIAALATLPAEDGWTAHPLFSQTANSLLASWKIWNTATVGGNIALGLPAGPMTALGAALDATAVILTAHGGERRMPVAEFVTAVRTNELAPGEVLRAIDIPSETLASTTAFRRIALSPLGRTGTLVIGRRDAGGEFVLTITGGTPRPRQLRFDEVPSEQALAGAVRGITDWYDDPHGSPDWRRAMSALFAEQIRLELGGAL